MWRYHLAFRWRCRYRRTGNQITHTLLSYTKSNLGCVNPTIASLRSKGNESFKNTHRFNS
uniref:Uncharacterized protein n=1 Tax=Helianthus annuus TaxID=4232 RepID=A0A251S8A4_HELAN